MAHRGRGRPAGPIVRGPTAGGARGKTKPPRPVESHGGFAPTASHKAPAPAYGTSMPSSLPLKVKVGRLRPFMYFAAVCESEVMRIGRAMVASQLT
jgi:hypothetical protein